MRRVIYVLIVVGLILGIQQCYRWAGPGVSRQNDLRDIKKGTTKEELMIQFSFEDLRTSRKEDRQEWLTFNYRWDKNDNLRDIITFYLEDDVVEGWKVNNRKQAVESYLSEFATSAFKHSFPNTYQALKNVLEKLPQDAFFLVTDRARPVIFTLHYTSTIARFASSNEFLLREDDPPTFGEGFYFIKLADELNYVEDIKAIEGIIFHELAHRVLDHLNQGTWSCETEREANRLVKKWGFEKEYKKASERFGSKSKADSPCHEEKSADKS